MNGGQPPRSLPRKNGWLLCAVLPSRHLDPLPFSSIRLGRLAPIADASSNEASNLSSLCPAALGLIACWCVDRYTQQDVGTLAACSKRTGAPSEKNSIAGTVSFAPPSLATTKR